MLDFSVSQILGGFIFGTLGVYFIKRGINKQNFIWIGLGALAIGYTFFVSNDWLVWILGIAITWAAYLTRRMY